MLGKDAEKLGERVTTCSQAQVSSPLYPWNSRTCQLPMHLPNVAYVDDDDALDGMHGEWCTTWDRRISILTFLVFFFFLPWRMMLDVGEVIGGGQD